MWIRELRELNRSKEGHTDRELLDNVLYEPPALPITEEVPEGVSRPIVPTEQETKAQALQRVMDVWKSAS